MRATHGHRLPRRDGTHQRAHPRADSSQNQAIELRSEVVEDTIVAWQIPDKKSGAEACQRAEQYWAASDPAAPLLSRLPNSEQRGIRKVPRKVRAGVLMHASILSG
jgi:hypothetical protein